MGGAWTPSTSGGNLTANATSAAMVIDATARVALAWSGDAVNIGVATDTSLQGITSTPVTTSDSGSSVIEPAAIAVLSDGSPVVAYVDSRTVSGVTAAIYVKKWMGTYWAPYTNSNTTTTTPLPGGGTVTIPVSTTGINAVSGPGHHIDMVVDNLDNPWVVWEDATTQQIYLRSWDGTNWVESGASAHDKGVSGATAPTSWPKIRWSASNQPILSWLEGGNQARVCNWVPPTTTP